MKDGKLEFVDVAQLAHENNRVYCSIIGDPIPVPWALLTSGEQNNLVEAVKAAHTDFRNGVVALDTALNSHNRWMTSKLKDGWKYGPVKDDTKKEHPCLLPLEELPVLQQIKDLFFLAITGVTGFEQAFVELNKE